MTGLPITPPPKPRSPWQRFYAAAHGVRRKYWTGRAQRLPRPVISIGNLSWAGSGKTPMTAAVAEFLHKSGRRVAILSRGYGSKGEGVRIVSRGDGPMLGPLLDGDEPVLLSALLPGVSVIVCPDRALAGRHAIERLDQPPDVFLLDDGFSHLRLERDLDILLFPADDPFSGGRLPPGGRLREPLSASARAHAAVLTSYRGDERHQNMGDQLARALRPHGFSGAGFTSAVECLPARPFLPGESLPTGSRVLVLAAIARPERLIDNVRAQGLEIADQIFLPDHHAYPDDSLGKIHQTFDDSGASWIVTTSKDLVKLQGRLELPIAELPIRARPENDFYRWLERSLGAIESQGQQ